MGGRCPPWIPSLSCSRHGSVGTLNTTLRPVQNGRHFADDTFKRIFLNQNVRNSIKISPKFVPKGRIRNIPSLDQIKAWCRLGNKPLSEPMTLRLLTHIYASLGLNEILHYHNTLLHRATLRLKNKMAAILQSTFSNALSCMKIVVFWFKFHWSLFARVQLMINQHWFR